MLTPAQLRAARALLGCAKMGRDNITTVAATYGAATFRAAIRTVDADNLLDDINRRAKALKSMDRRADARSWVISAIERASQA
jgi:hypothetical protein